MISLCLKNREGGGEFSLCVWKRFEVVGLVEVQCLSLSVAVCFSFFK